MAGRENSFDVGGLARFAVANHNKKKNATLQFENVVEHEKVVRAGTEYTIIIEATDGSVKNQYEAKVYADPLMNIKEVHEFNLKEAKASTKLQG